MQKQGVVLAAAIVVVGLCGAVAAQGRSGGRGQGQGQGQGGGQDAGVKVAATVVFRASDQATYREYFRTHRITAEPLPPGIAKNVARGKPLPPGIAKRALPADLVALGPKADRDVSFAIVGEVVVALRSGVVIDVLAGVFR